MKYKLYKVTALMEMGDDPPVIECKVCAEKYYFKRVMRWDPWTGAYWDEWKIQEK